MTGGVAAAVKEAIKEIDPDREVLVEHADGLRECRKMLLMAKTGKYNGYLLEGMGCPGGCVAGAGTITPVRESTLNVEKFKKEAAEVSSTASPMWTSERRGGITAKARKRATQKGGPLCAFPEKLWFCLHLVQKNHQRHGPDTEKRGDYINGAGVVSFMTVDLSDLSDVSRRRGTCCQQADHQDGLPSGTRAARPEYLKIHRTTSGRAISRRKATFQMLRMRRTASRFCSPMSMPATNMREGGRWWRQWTSWYRRLP